ncbi:MAG: hypothetical protein CFH01_00365 [Alphaproteobacteria bacterium MarineAlpha2_Bin1]|nr:MAG: hypothetical protein CFH01_00365 [Alphaproteobacteria bacterium MarineAlpha2_Bin1]
MNKNNVVVMIPSYNEGDIINLICDNINKLNPLYTILVLDDGSKNVFKPKKKIKNLYIYNSKINYGLGVTTNIAINFMLKNKFDFLVRIDGDNQHPIDCIPKLIEKMMDGSDFCVGTRVNAEIGVTIRQKLNKYIKRYFNFMGKILISRDIPSDLSSGFMAFNQKSAMYLSSQVLDRYPEPEIIMLLTIKKFNVNEIMIEQFPRKFGVSSIKYFRGVLLVYKFNVFLLNNFLSKVIKLCKL